RRHRPAGRLKPQVRVQGPGDDKGRGLTCRLRPGGRRPQRRSCSVIWSALIRMKNPGSWFHQAGVVATPACVLSSSG
ncbi:MAG TPA: hypothetical protein PKD72_16870, partial [Gemmatales bacterium]|nr:hypothetical protein [Gemmatales bacterium]